MGPMSKAPTPSYWILPVLALLAGVLLWLVFTHDGRRRVDLTLSSLRGQPRVELSLLELNSHLTESNVRARLPGVDLQCTDGQTPFGERACAARIGAYGRLPAEALAFHFTGGDLRAAKLNYRRDVHRELVASLIRRLGEGETTRRSAAGGAGRVLNWPLVDGVLLLNAGDLVPAEEPALLWLSSAVVEERMHAGRVGGGAPR
jgi:hypothetical protein